MLFTDDMLVLMTDPEKSLPALDLLLRTFGQISGLKLNSTKTLLYPINIPNQLKSKLQFLFSFRWVESALPYEVTDPVGFEPDAYCQFLFLRG